MVLETRWRQTDIVRYRAAKNQIKIYILLERSIVIVFKMRLDLPGLVQHVPGEHEGQ